MRGCWIYLQGMPRNLHARGAASPVSSIALFQSRFLSLCLSAPLCIDACHVTVVTVEGDCQKGLKVHCLVLVRHPQHFWQSPTINHKTQLQSLRFVDGGVARRIKLLLCSLSALNVALHQSSAMQLPKCHIWRATLAAAGAGATHTDGCGGCIPHS